jgi:hypothetical protein
VTAVLFILALVVAALGIPGVLPWLQDRTCRSKAIDVPISDYIASLPTVRDPRSLVRPSSPSGVVRPPGPSPIPSLGALRAATQADLRDAVDAEIKACWARVNADGPRPVCERCGRTYWPERCSGGLCLNVGISSPPAPPPRPRLD